MGIGTFARGRIGVLFAFFVIVGACSPTASSTVPTAAPPDGTIKTIPYLTNESDPASVEIMQAIFAEYSEQHADVVLDLVLGGHSDIGQRLVAAQSVGADLGIVTVQATTVSDFIAAGYLLPLDDFIAKIGEDKFKPSSLVRGADGHIYAVAYSGGTHGALWYRKDMLADAGLQPPKTFNELLAAAKAMTKDTNGDGTIDVYGIGLPAGSDGATDARFFNFLYRNCGDYFDKKGNLVFDRPQVLTAVKQYVDLLEYAPPSVTGWSWLDGIDAFIAGKVAMHPYGGRLGVRVESAAPDVRANTGVIRFPAGDKIDAGYSFYDYLAVYNGTRYPADVQQFLEFFFTGDRLARLLETVPGHLIPPTTDLADTIVSATDNEYISKYAADVRALFDASTYGASPSINMGAVNTDTCALEPTVNPMPWGPQVFSEPNTLTSQMIQRVVVNGETPEAAWQWATGELKRISDEWKAAHPEWKPAN